MSAGGYRFLRDARAASTAEFALVLPLLLIFMFGIIDVGRLMWTWNRAEKATQMGARFAVVTNMVPATLATQNFALSNGVPGGSPVPTSAFSSTSCDDAGCSGGWGYDSNAFSAIVTRMRLIMPNITAANVIVDYENVGLGYAGDPNGPDVAPLVTVRLRNMTFRPITLIVFNGNFNLPDFRTALTLEDGQGLSRIEVSR
jgi:hypothetical protein